MNASTMASLGLFLVTWMGWAVDARAVAPDVSMRPYVLDAVDKLATERKSGKYDIRKYFTQDLTYGQACCIPASSPRAVDPGPNPTMCVAAVAEVIVEALTLYGQKTGDWTFAEKLPIGSWKSGRLTGIRANLFQYQGTGSRGTGHALKLLGLGTTKPFEQLLPGDFVTFNRVGGPGHAVVFLGFIEAGSTEPRSVHSSDVVGFRYFSAQGKNRADGGFSFRNAYFDGKCPVPRGRDDDCKLIRTSPTRQNYTLLNTGELWLPTAWDTAGAQARLANSVTRGFERKGLTRGAAEAATRVELERELEPNYTKYEDGTE